MKITSVTNPLVKHVVRLHDAKERKKTNLFLIEGQRALETAVTTLQLHTLFCTPDKRSIASDLAPASQIIEVTDAVMKKMSPSVAPSGLLGTLHIPPPPAPQNLEHGLVLLDVSDPGNMGTLIRTAAACAIRSVVIIGGVDPWNPKVVQSSAGTHALVNIFQWDVHTLLALKKKLKLHGLVVAGGAPLSSIDPKDALLIVGNEARGIDQAMIKQCDSLITLAMPGETESLNAAVAGSIALYELFVAKQS